MKLCQLGVWILVTVSVILFIRASIVPFFAVYGDPLDEMLMSAFSLAFISAAFALIAKKGSFIVGSVMAGIGAFYIYNSNRMLGLVLRDAEYIPYPEGMINANVYTMIIGVIILALGIYSIIRRAEERSSKAKNISVNI
ncbi:MAG TPA: hypothetical protein VF172_01415 [Nitrososphaera sp.]|jgi:hypothetical protein